MRTQGKLFQNCWNENGVRSFEIRPVIIKYPFWRMIHEWKNVVYICINAKETYAPEEILDRSVCINDDIGEVLQRIKD